MKKFIFLLFLCGCASNSKYSATTEAKTSYYPYAQQNIEKIDFSVQLKKEWQIYASFTYYIGPIKRK